MFPVFDGHNDILGKLVRRPPRERVEAFLHGSDGLHIDLPKAREGGLAGGLFAMFPPSPGDYAFADYATELGYDVPLPPPLPEFEAVRSTVEMAALLHRLVEASEGRLALCRCTADVRAAMKVGRIGAVLHLEGADPIGPDLDMLEVLYAAGLRSLGIVWSRPTIFGEGVPFRFPSSPDTGTGLTELGRNLVRRCNERKILIDLSHITEAGFWDVARTSDAPLVATHSNAHALCPSARNLSDDQIAAIRDSGGIVGVNFATSFLRSDGAMTADTPISEIMRHIEGLLERAGEACVGLGSDFDGATIPAALGSAAGLPRIFEELQRRGYSSELLCRLASGNWMSVLDRTIG